MKRSNIDSYLRAADPITDEDVSAWLRSPTAAQARAVSTQVTDPPQPTATRPRLTVVALAAALVLVIGAAAGTAVVLLGEPAPTNVKRDLRGVDAGFPADLRYNPDVEHARSVAVSANATQYVAQLRGGGYCTEMVISGIPRGAVCATGEQVQREPIEVTIPFTDPVTATSPVTLGGRVNVPGAASVEIRYGDGATDPVGLGDGGYFVFDVPASHLGLVHGSDFQVVALDSSGRKVASIDVRAVAPEPAGPMEDNAPITVDTISQESDLTKVLGIRGRVNAEGAVSLEFAYPDGTTVSIPLAEDGSYGFDIPSGRQDQLFHAPGTLIARDKDGGEVASVPVASVAFWRAHGGQP